MTCFLGRELPTLGGGYTNVTPVTGYVALHLKYALITQLFPAWSLRDIVGLTHNQREYWIEMGLYNAAQKAK